MERLILLVAFVLDGFELLEATVEGALDASFVASQAVELLLQDLVIEDRGIRIVTRAGFCFHAAHAPKLPRGGDYFIAKRLLNLAFRPEVIMVTFSHFVELFLFLGGHEDFG